MKQLTAYECDHCRKLYRREHAAVRHEETCFHNPINDRPCFHCINLIKKEATIYGDYPNGTEWERKVELLHCSKFNTFLYTPKNESKGNHYDLGDDENVPMPTDCSLYSNELEEVTL